MERYVRLDECPALNVRFSAELPARRPSAVANNERIIIEPALGRRVELKLSRQGLNATRTRVSPVWRSPYRARINPRRQVSVLGGVGGAGWVSLIHQADAI